MAWSNYRRLLHAHPLKTKALTSSFITGFSDVCLQLYEHNSNRLTSEPKDEATKATAQGQAAVSSTLHDLWPARFIEASSSFSPSDLKWSRTFTLAAVGLLYSGPINHLWFGALEKIVRVRHHVGSVGLKLFLDQLMFAPAAIAGYMAVRGVLESKSELQIRAQLHEKVALATQAAWQFWPVVNFISFSMVPVVYRVLFGNVCAIYWNAQLSHISSQGSNAKETQSEQTAVKQSRAKEILSEQTVAAVQPYKVTFVLSSCMSAVLTQLLEQAAEGFQFCLQCQDSCLGDGYMSCFQCQGS